MSQSKPAEACNVLPKRTYDSVDGSRSIRHREKPIALLEKHPNGGQPSKVGDGAWWMNFSLVAGSIRVVNFAQVLDDSCKVFSPRDDG
ncbi:MAG: hypothetical protein QW179_02420 [Candidatus Hadarchaeales archaeon]